MTQNYYYSFASLLALPFCLFQLVGQDTSLLIAVTSGWSFYFISHLIFLTYTFITFLTLFSILYFYLIIYIMNFFLDKCSRTMPAVFLTLVPKLTTPLEVITFALSPCTTSLSVLFVFLYTSHEYLLLTPFATLPSSDFVFRWL